MSSATRVVHAIRSMECGGMEQVVLDLCQLGPSLGQEIHVLCLEARGPWAPILENSGVPVDCLNKAPGFQLKLIPQFYQTLARIRPAIVHTHQLGALFYAGLAARVSGIPVVHTQHGSEYALRKRIRQLGRLSGRFAKKVCCVSPAVAEELRRFQIVPCDKISILHNGIDTARFAASRESSAIRRELRIAAETPVVGTVGRLDRVKSHDVLMRGYADLKSQFSDLQLLVVGDGPTLPELEALARHLGVGQDVHFVGQRSDRERFLAAMDIFAITSRDEGLPLSVLEAWAAGKPVVASAVGGLPDLVQHGKTGLLFPTGDTGALREQLETLLRNPSLASRMSEQARAEVIASFDASVMAGRYQEEYSCVLGSVSPCSTVNSYCSLFESA